MSTEIQDQATQEQQQAAQEQQAAASGQGGQGQDAGSVAADEAQQRQQQEVPEWLRKRFADLTQQRRQAEERASHAERMAQELLRSQQHGGQPHEGSTEGLPAAAQPYTNQNVMLLAQQMAAQQLQQQQFMDATSKLDQAGRQLVENYDQRIDNLKMAGAATPEFVEALVAVPGAEKVAAYLGDPMNLEEALRIAALPPIRMAVELVQIAEKAKKAFSKPVSKAPAPIDPLGGGSASSGGEPDAKKDPKAWIAWRNENARRKY